MSRSFRHTYRECSAKPVRGFYAGKIREMNKKRRYAARNVVDEDGTPILPHRISKTWPVYSHHGWWNEEPVARFLFHRKGRKFIKFGNECRFDYNGKNLSRLGRLK